MVTGPDYVTLKVDPLAGFRARMLEVIQPMLDANQAMARKVLKANQAVVSPALQATLARVAEAYKPAFDSTVFRVAEAMAPIIEASRFDIAQSYARPVVDTSRLGNIVTLAIDISWLAEAIRPVIEASRFAEAYLPTFDRLLADMFDPDTLDADLWDGADDPTADDAADLAGVEWWLRTWDGMALGEQLVAVTALLIVLYLSAYTVHAALDPTESYNPAAALAELARSLVGNVGASVLVTIVLARRMGR